MVNNEDILKDILLKMNYDPSKSLNENIEEQMGEKTWMTPRGMSYSENLKAQQLKPLSKEDRHLLMDIAAVGAFFIPVVGPFLSLGIELANAGLYYSEGDKEGAGFALAFALIPMGELVGKIPAVKKLGRNGLSSLIRKARTGGKLTKAETEAVEQINKNKKWLSLKAAKEASKIFIKGKLKKATLKDIVYGVYKYAKKNPNKFSLAKNGLVIGGIWYSYAKLVEIYGIGQESQTPQMASKSNDNNGEQIVTDFDKNWDYKKDGDKYYTKKKDSDKWILASGNAEKSIREKVFGKGQSKSKSSLTPEQKKLEQQYLSDKEEITEQVTKQVASTINTVDANKGWDDAFSDI
ncbi:hypothetical protein N9H63_01265 [bacterium]|nr:hypothetical protein [bacterium]